MVVEDQYFHLVYIYPNIIHKITNLRNFFTQFVTEVARKYWKKNTLVAQVCVPSDAWKGLRAEAFQYLSEKWPLSQKLRLPEGAVSYNVLYYQQLSTSRYP